MEKEKWERIIKAYCSGEAIINIAYKEGYMQNHLAYRIKRSDNCYQYLKERIENICNKYIEDTGNYGDGNYRKAISSYSGKLKRALKQCKDATELDETQIAKLKAFSPLVIKLGDFRQVIDYAYILRVNDEVKNAIQFLESVQKENKKLNKTEKIKLQEYLNELHGVQNKHKKTMSNRPTNPKNEGR